jgi:hypothetical protein
MLNFIAFPITFGDSGKIYKKAAEEVEERNPKQKQHVVTKRKTFTKVQ